MNGAGGHGLRQLRAGMKKGRAWALLHRSAWRHVVEQDRLADPGYRLVPLKPRIGRQRIIRFLAVSQFFDFERGKADGDPACRWLIGKKWANCGQPMASQICASEITDRDFRNPQLGEFLTQALQVLTPIQVRLNEYALRRFWSGLVEVGQIIGMGQCRGNGMPEHQSE